MSRVKDALGKKPEKVKATKQRINTMVMNVCIQSTEKVSPILLTVEGTINPKDRSANNYVIDNLYRTLKKMFADPLEGDKPVMVVPGLATVKLVEPSDTKKPEVKKAETKKPAVKKKASKKKSVIKKIAKKRAAKKKTKSKKKS